MSEERENVDPFRRRVLRWFIRVTSIGWAMSVLYPVLRYLRPLPNTGAGGPVPLPPEKLADVMGRQAYTILRAAGTRILVLRDDADALRAYSAVCTHEACTVQYVPADSTIWCACHNGKFALDGRVISGPPPRPLPRYQMHKDENGQWQVRLEEA